VDHPHIWGTDELIQKLLDGVFASEAILSSEKNSSAIPKSPNSRKSHFYFTKNKASKLEVTEEIKPSIFQQMTYVASTGAHSGGDRPGR
jgi:hypothetical protein